MKIKFGQKARRTKIKTNMSHPYMEYENTALWIVLQKAINELKENQDIEITTKEEYVIGYLCKSLKDNAGMVTPISIK